MPKQLPIKEKIEKGRLLKVAPFRKEIRRTTAHKHNSYFEIIFISKGSGQHYTDSTAHPINPPALFFVRKEQMHHWDISSDPDGFVLIVKKEFVELSKDIELKHLIGRISSHAALYPENASTIDLLFQLLVTEVNPDGDNNNAIIEGLLKALLAKIIEAEAKTIISATCNSSLFEQFNAVLNSVTPVRNSVAFYAAMLHTTPQNLNAVCRKISGQSASEIVAGFIISEAKRLMIYTDQNISEIAHQLDFKDNSHFVKYFKRKTGLTPVSFRKTV